MSKRKLIEVSLPLKSLNLAAQKDKNPFLKGHPRSLHLWWSRKPLAVCRAILFASLVDDPESRPDLFPTLEEQNLERQRLLAFMETLIAWTGKDDVLEDARLEIEKYTNGFTPSIYDPFAGGGSIPLEAKRLGLEAHSADINPLAVIINKALVEIPQKFSDGPSLVKAIRHYGQWMQAEGKNRLASYYNGQNVIAWLYCRSVKCSNNSCGAYIPLISKFWLCTKSGKQAWLSPVVESGQVRFQIETGTADESLKSALAAGTRLVLDTGKIAKAAFQCLVCGECIRGKFIQSQSEKNLLGFLPLAKVVQEKRKRKYEIFSLDEMNNIDSTCKTALDNYCLLSSVPIEKARGTFASNAQGRSYGFDTFADYFLPRQLLSLCVLSDLIDSVKQDILHSGQWQLSDDGKSLESGGCGLTAFADAVCTYLAFAVNHLVRYSTLLNPWNTTNQNVAQIFGRQGLQMTWDFAEANILEGILTIATASEWVAAAVENLPAKSDKSTTVSNLNSASFNSVAHDAVIITDPPYYNYISYADLSDFFYVWLKRSLDKIHPQLLSTSLVPKADELIMAPHRFNGDETRARRHFIDGMTDSFASLGNIAHANYPAAVFYAFNPKEIEQLAGKNKRGYDFSGWEAMLESLLSSGWMLTAYWTLATERSTRMVARGTKSLASSLLLIVRRRPKDAPDISAQNLRHQLSIDLPSTIGQLEKDKVAQVDRLQLSLIEGAKILSQFEHVLDAEGKPMPVSQAIKLVINQLFENVT